jgi:hypothetical protein
MTRSFANPRRLLAALLLTALLGSPQGLRAQSHSGAHALPDLHSIKVVDVFNLFPNVGALIYVAGPNDFGLPEGIVTSCTGTLIHPRAVLVAGHCTAPTAGGLLPFIKAYMSFSPNVLDPSTWRPVSSFAFHPSLPPCPPPEGCTFEGLAPGILDIGLVFLNEPIRDITPAKFALPGTLETDRAARAFMILPGYGFLNSVPGGPYGGMPPPISEWDGWRRIKISKLSEVVDNEWASWSLPGVACYGDSGAPTFFSADPFAGRRRDRIVAVVSDGGWTCFSRDDRARVDTHAAQDWINETIASAIAPAH